MRTAVILAAAVLSSCAIITGEGDLEEALNPTPAIPDYVQPEYGDYSEWVGRSMEELIRELGHPHAVYEARHTFADYDVDLPAMTLVYVTDTSYVDAYVVDLRTKTIIKYHRR